MKNPRPRKASVRCLIYTLVLTTTMVCTLQIGGHAMLAPAQIPAQMDSSGYDRAQDMKTIQTALESKIVQERLKEFGLSNEQVQSRLGKLSDKQVHQLAQQSQTLSAGGDDGGGVVFGLLLLTVLVLLIVYLVKHI